MPEERRSARRARVPGMRVTYETASGERVDDEALDVSAGGLFVRSASPIPVGKRLSLEIRLAQGDKPWSALARVIWTRDAATDGGPAGMGVKLIDADDALIAVIERLVASREPTEPGTGGTKVPARERTVLGVGRSEEPAAAAAPIIAVASMREKTVLGVGAPAAAPAAKPPAREPSGELPPVEGWDAPESDEAQQGQAAPAPAQEPSIAIDLVAKKPERDVPQPEASETSLAAAEVPRRGGRGWLVVVVILAVAAGALYLNRDRIPQLRAWLGTSTPAPAVPAPPASSVPPAPAVPPTTTTAPVPPASAPAVVSAVTSAPAPGTSKSASPSRSAPPATPSKRPKAASGDNPY
ncbi:MAG TPA: PilZ domain-containing protein [Polyangiaceae bacterium]